MRCHSFFLLQQEKKVGWILAGSLAAVVALSLLFLDFELFFLGQGELDSSSAAKNRHLFNISRGFVISLNPEDSLDIVEQAKTFIYLPNVTVFRGINGSQALEQTSRAEEGEMVALYTRYVMMMGRSDHMQLSNPSMLGCLLSHISIWKRIRPQEVIAVFEEDAYMDQTSSLRMKSLSVDMLDLQWDVLMLESGQIIASGTWEYIGEYAATCALSQNSTLGASKTSKKNLCTWFGTRGYLITYEGAQKLLSHAFPVHVQIDALMGLLAAFKPDFKMYWTRENVVHQKMFYITQVWDACFKCYMPQQTLFYVSLLLAAAWTCAQCACHTRQKFKNYRFQAS